MKSKNRRIIGRCCNRKGTYLITYEGSPSFDESIIICKIHRDKFPFTEDVKKIEKICDD